MPLRSVHAGLQAEHAHAQAELAVAEERLSGLQDLQLRHDGLQVSINNCYLRIWPWMSDMRQCA